VTCHRRYTFTVLASDLASSSILEAMYLWCDRHWWFNSPEVEEPANQTLEVSFDVSARDQWWAHRRAMDMMEQVLWPQPVPTPIWDTLPPHTNRGRYRR
jgi:hypothetical protein